MKYKLVVSDEFLRENYDNTFSLRESWVTLTISNQIKTIKHGSPSA